MKGLVKKLTAEGSGGCTAAVVEVPEKRAEYVEIERSPEFDRYLRHKNIRLYGHQVEVIQKIRDGKNVALVTPTASGKTLAFTLPVMERLRQLPSRTALYLYPMKALANDQLRELEELEEAAGGDIGTGVYDGDTPRSRRKKIRENCRLILTNPHALHWYLAWHPLWQKFWRGLNYVVLDEAHWYRGIYGTNVAFLLRRLQRILHYYDADPLFVLSSATMADPLEHAWKLTGREFELVKSDSSARGKKTFVFWDASRKPERSSHVQTADIVALCVKHNLQTLCFTVSRKMAELTAMWSNEQVEGEIAPYRAGYLPAERRELEEKFKNGNLAGIASTNALELGINIGGLDAVVIGGYPGTVSSFHQRAGRAGRTGKDSLVVQVLFDNPLDGYILANPHYLFSEPSEQAVISLDNSSIMKNHVMCASEELPLEKEDEEWFGENYVDCVKELLKGRLIRPYRLNSNSSSEPKRYVYNGKGSCFHVNLSSLESDTYRLTCGDRLLEELGRRQAYYEAHPGAVFLHRAAPYRVLDLDEEAREIKLAPCESNIYTTPLTEVNVKIEEIQKERSGEGYKLCFGTVTATETVYGYVLRSYNRVVERQYLKRPLDVKFETKGAWAVLEEKAIRGSRDGGFHAAEHLLIGVSPLLAMCDRWDLGGLSVAAVNTIYLYDAFPGGIGIAERLFGQFEVLAEKALEVALSCACEDGCPRCVMSPKCGNNNEPLDKKAAVDVLNGMVVKVHSRLDEGNKNKEVS